MQSRTREFQEELSKSHALHGEEVQKKPILQPGESGIAGVVRSRPIPFQDLAIGPIIEFLTMKFKEGIQYSTMTSYRSALPATLPPIEGHAPMQLDNIHWSADYCRVCSIRDHQLISATCTRGLRRLPIPQHDRLARLCDEHLFHLPCVHI